MGHGMMEVHALHVLIEEKLHGELVILTWLTDWGLVENMGIYSTESSLGLYSLIP